MTLSEAASSLIKHFGDNARRSGGWLQSVGVGGNRIVVYANSRPFRPVPETWEGWPVEFEVVGPLFPLGADPNEVNQ